MHAARFGLLLLSLLTLSPTAMARGGLGEPLTERGRLIEDIYYQVFIAGVVVFILVFALLAYVLWKYRASSGAGRATWEKERHDTRLEVLWIGVPLILVMWIGVISYAGLIELDEGIDPDDAFLEIRVIGSQWNWEADYGEGVSLFANPDPAEYGAVSDDNVFYIPANQPILWNFTSADVIHAWYMLDENDVAVAMVDMQPTGPQQYNLLTTSLPEGSYEVRCNQHCLNPGHAYMKARVEAVPLGEFQAWFRDDTVRASFGFINDASTTLSDAGFVDGEGNPASVTAVLGSGGVTGIFLNIENTGATATVSASGNGPITFPDATSEQVQIPSGATRSFVFGVTETGTYTVSAGDHELSVEVIEAEVVDVVLGEYFIDPTTLRLEPDTTYLINVLNEGGQTHNVYFGSFGGTTTAASATIGGAQATSFVYTTPNAGSFETWCNVPGHYELGMRGQLTIS